MQPNPIPVDTNQLLTTDEDNKECELKLTVAELRELRWFYESFFLADGPYLTQRATRYDLARAQRAININRKLKQLEESIDR